MALTDAQLALIRQIYTSEVDFLITQAKADALTAMAIRTPEQQAALDWYNWKLAHDQTVIQAWVQSLLSGSVDISKGSDKNVIRQQVYTEMEAAENALQVQITVRLQALATKEVIPNDPALIDQGFVIDLNTQIWQYDYDAEMTAINELQAVVDNRKAVLSNLKSLAKSLWLTR